MDGVAGTKRWGVGEGRGQVWCLVGGQEGRGRVGAGWDECGWGDVKAVVMVVIGNGEREVCLVELGGERRRGRGSKGKAACGCSVSLKCWLFECRNGEDACGTAEGGMKTSFSG